MERSKKDVELTYDRDEARSAIRRLREILFNFGHETPKKIVVEKAPDDWDHLGALDDDLWKAIDLGPKPNAFANVYRTDKGGIFQSHYHPNNETVVVVKGKVKVVTPFNTKNLGPGDSAIIKKEIPHRFYFDKETTIILTFQPEIDGVVWEATPSEMVPVHQPPKIMWNIFFFFNKIWRRFLKLFGLSPRTPK